MPAQYPAINDAEYDLLKKLVQNTYLIVNGGGGGGGGVWGAITGTLSNQTDLQSALNAKANTFTADNGLTLTGGSLNVDAVQTTITSITTASNFTLVIGGFTTTFYNNGVFQTPNRAIVSGELTVNNGSGAGGSIQVGASGGSVTPFMSVSNDTNDVAAGSSIEIYGYNGSSRVDINKIIFDKLAWGVGNEVSRIRFQTANNGTLADALTLDNLGAGVFSGTASATGFLVGVTAGIDAAITSGGLVGKTITVTKGIITGFA